MHSLFENVAHFPFAQTLVTYQWLRVEQLDQWWHWIAISILCTAVLVFVHFWYRRDAVEQSRPVGWALTVLRIAAMLGLLLFFFQLDKRSEQRIVRDSRVAVLVDTSLSMSLPGTPSESGVASTISRAEEATQLLEQSSFLAQLADQHQVSVYRFADLSRPTQLAAITKRDIGVEEADSSGETTGDSTELQTGRSLLVAAGIAAALASIFIVVAFSAQIAGLKEWAAGGWLLLLGSTLTLVALVLSAFGVVPNTKYPIRQILGYDVASVEEVPEVSESDTEGSGPLLPENWGEELAARGTQSRIGDAVKSILDREQGGPLAAIVLLTDGRSNAGAAPREILPTAQNSRVPLYVVGLGSPTSPPNVELAELDVPKRLYPGDPFTLSALVGSSGMAGKTVTVQVLTGAESATEDQMAIEDEKTVVLEDDKSLATVSFQLEPKALGSWQYTARVLPLSGEADITDNLQSSTVEVIERKNRVLILAGGPTREYQFVRNLLYRDKDVESHVLLQSGTARSSQEAQKLIDTFPLDRTELSQYDAILAFDADWTEIPDLSTLALEQWVAEQAGGFVMIAGSVEMPKWLARSASSVAANNLRALSPVVLERRGSSLLSVGRVEAESPWPLDVTTDGSQVDFLRLDEDPVSSMQLWTDFTGVHSFYAAFELKPGGKSLLTFSDPTAALDGQPPIYLATQFYGAGRTAYLGGGEIWRIRQEGDFYFDRFYTKLVRWVSQGRLLLDSDRGVLLVDREKAVLGEQVSLRAVLKNERYEPLVQNEVVARLIDPKQSNVPVTLRPLADGSQPGVYTGQFPVLMAGEYTAQIQLGGLASEEILDATVQATVPALEMQGAERNDDLLAQMAVETGGIYWAGIETAVTPNEKGQAAIIAAIPAQDQIAYLPGAPDRIFQLRWLGWLMVWIASCLSLEWFSRRIHRLA